MRRSDAERVPRHAGEALDVMLRAHCGIEAGFDLADVRRFKNENIAEAGLGEIINNLVHENLVAGVHITTRNNLSSGVFAARKHSEIPHQRITRRKNRVAVPAADDLREGEKVQVGFLLERHNDILLLRPEVEMVASTHDQIKRPHEQVWRRIFGRHADDSVKCRLHRAGGNAEGLEKISLHACGKHDRHHEHFDVLAKSGIFHRRNAFSNQLIDMAHLLGDCLAASLAHGRAKFFDGGLDLGDTGGSEDIALVGEKFFRALEILFCLLDVAGCEEKHGASSSCGGPG